MQPSNNQKTSQSSQNQQNRTRAGFTLIELMVAMAILTVLAAAAYPFYQQTIRQTRRTEGRTALLQLMQQQERYYSQHMTYLAFTAAQAATDNNAFKWFSGSQPARSAYALAASACSEESLQDCVVLTAKPGDALVNSSYSDPVCGVLTFSSNGLKSPANTECWP